METHKRVSWVELYLDLVFVLAVAQIAHLIVAEPEMHSVWVALGLFFTLWWTWVGFAVLYNRHGADERRQRVLFLIASIPTGVAAVAIEPARPATARCSRSASRDADRDRCADGIRRGPALRQRITLALLLSAALFLVSIWVPEPFRYVLWGIAIFNESSAMLAEDREAQRRARRERSWEALKPSDPNEALDAHHFAERFGLFLIILLGEVVVEAGQASVDGHVASVAGWFALVAAMILAAALWWLYFDSAVELNLRVLELSGRLTDDGARDLRGRSHAARVRVADHRGRRRAAARGGPAADRLRARVRRRRDLHRQHPGVVGRAAAARPRAADRGRRRNLQLAWLDLEPRPYLWLLAGAAVLWALIHTRRSDYDDATSRSIASAESGAPQSSSDAGAGRL